MVSTRNSDSFVFPSRETVILPVVLHLSEIWSLSVADEHTLRVSDDTALSRIFASKRGSYRRLEKVNNAVKIKVKLSLCPF
jgi:hypothetical protein